VAALAIAAPPLAAASTPPPPRSALKDFGCHRSSDSLSRWIGVTAVMRPVSGTAHMAMKFQLLRKRTHGQSFVDVSGGDLGKWIHPTDPPTLGQRPGDHWTVQKQVVNLDAPAVYRFRVSFHWLGSGGQVLHAVAQLGKMCNQ
jgi:hypothetical protein